jgi:hypothetical protein
VYINNHVPSSSGNWDISVGVIAWYGWRAGVHFPAEAILSISKDFIPAVVTA